MLSWRTKNWPHSINIRESDNIVECNSRQWSENCVSCKKHCHQAHGFDHSQLQPLFSNPLTFFAQRASACMMQEELYMWNSVLLPTDKNYHISEFWRCVGCDAVLCFLMLPADIMPSLTPNTESHNGSTIRRAERDKTLPKQSVIEMTLCELNIPAYGFSYPNNNAHCGIFRSDNIHVHPLYHN